MLVCAAMFDTISFLTFILEEGEIYFSENSDTSAQQRETRKGECNHLKSVHSSIVYGTIYEQIILGFLVLRRKTPSFYSQ